MFLIRLAHCCQYLQILFNNLTCAVECHLIKMYRNSTKLYTHITPKLIVRQWIETKTNYFRWTGHCQPDAWNDCNEYVHNTHRCNRETHCSSESSVRMGYEVIWDMVNRRGYMVPCLIWSGIQMQCPFGVIWPLSPIGANIFSYRATAKCSLTLPAAAVTSGA